VSSEEVPPEKPAPDVYLEALRPLHIATHKAVAVEDCANGIRAAHAAGMRVIAIPNRRYPPPDGVLALADAVCRSPGELAPTVIRHTATARMLRAAIVSRPSETGPVPEASA